MTAGILFDCDGTLIDTFDGIIAGVQRMRARFGADPLPPEQVRPHIGWGVANLIGHTHPRAVSPSPDGAPGRLSPAELEEGIRLFREEYARDLVAGCAVYPGIHDLVERLARDRFRLALVSNKPERFLHTILTGHGLAALFSIVIGGDSLPVLKPDPEPLHHAARALGLPSARCIMVGDSRIDIEAARAAAMPVIAVTWGFLTAEECSALRPDALAGTAEELEARLRAWAAGIADAPAR